MPDLGGIATQFLTFTNKTLTDPVITLTDSNYITGSTAKFGFSGGNTFDILPIAGSSFGFLRIMPSYSTVGDTSVRSAFRLKNSTDGTNEEYCEFISFGTVGYLLHSSGSGSGIVRPLMLGSNGIASITINNDNSMNFNSRTITNFVVDVRGTGNSMPNMPVNPLVKRWGCFQPSTATGTTAPLISSLDGILAGSIATGAGTNTITFDTTEGVIANFVGTATANLNLGIVAGTAGPICRRLFGLKMSCRVKIDSTTSARMFVGFSAAALAISDVPMASGTAGVLVGFISTATNFEIYNNDSTAGFVTTALTNTVAKNSSWHTIEINWAASGNVDVIFDGVTTTLTTQQPATTDSLFFNCVGQTTTTTARTFSIHSIWIECDK